MSRSARRRLSSLKRFIFVSYAKRDEARVKPALAAAIAHGHVLWVDQFELETQSRSADIEAAIRASRGVIVFWSVDAFASNEVSREVATAARLGKPILPVFLDDIQVHRAIQASDPKWREKLASALETLPLRSLSPPSKPFIQRGAPVSQIARRPPARATLFYEVNWLAGAFVIVFAALFTIWGAMISGGPPSSMELALVRDEVSAAYVTSLRRLEDEARRLRANYCSDQPLRSSQAVGAWRGKTQAACLSGPDS